MTTKPQLTQADLDMLFIERVRQLLIRLTDAERLKLLNDLFEGYCRNCGTPDPRCPCANDE